MHIWDITLTKAGNQPEGWFEVSYVYFNWFEAASWFVLAAFIAWRFLKNRRSPVELLYALSVMLFGVTDVLEVYELTLGLFFVKALVLVSILLCRSSVVKVYAVEGYKL